MWRENQAKFVVRDVFRFRSDSKDLDGILSVRAFYLCKSEVTVTLLPNFTLGMLHKVIVTCSPINNGKMLFTLLTELVQLVGRSIRGRGKLSSVAVINHVIAATKPGGMVG
jgi:hypothetical protein